jgi:hypothetical protein
VNTKEKALCFSCLYRDSRPETGMGDGLIYCIKKERVVGPKFSCELYAKSTDRSREDLKSSMYGSYSEEEDG